MIQRDLPDENNQKAEDLFKPAISRPFQNGVGTLEGHAPSWPPQRTRQSASLQGTLE